MKLLPFFSYYGAKHRACAHLPAPEHNHIIEAFAGSAAYACRYPDRAVTLVEINPAVAAMWRYLVATPAAEILALPDLRDDVASMPICEEAKILVGFWLNRGASGPRRQPSAWMRSGVRPASFWGPEARDRIARQVDAIRHWRVIEGSYSDLELNPLATWVVDPPYSCSAGRHYPFHEVDFAHLADWCRSRNGTVIAHEAEGATWLPFEPWMHIKANESRGGGKISKEALCILRNGTTQVAA